MKCICGNVWAIYQPKPKIVEVAHYRQRFDLHILVWSLSDIPLFFPTNPHNSIVSSSHRLDVTIIVILFICDKIIQICTQNRRENKNSLDEKRKFSFCMHIANWHLISLYWNVPYISITLRERGREEGGERERESTFCLFVWCPHPWF